MMCTASDMTDGYELMFLLREVQECGAMLAFSAATGGFVIDLPSTHGAAPWRWDSGGTFGGSGTYRNAWFALRQAWEARRYG